MSADFMDKHSAFRNAVWAFALLLVSASSAEAHAFIDHASPAVGSTVQHSPADVRIWFTTALVPGALAIAVSDAAGQAVDKGDKHLDSADQSILKVSLPQLPPGLYKVVWRVVSAVDTHATTGSFSFTVAP